MLTESTFAFPTGVLHNDTLFAFGTVTFMFDGTEGSDHTVATAVVKVVFSSVQYPVIQSQRCFHDKALDS